MMKKFFTAISACISAVLLYAQSDIMALEYYIDNDPGVGLATSVTVTQGQEVDLNFTVPISSMSLTQGPHLMVVRAQNLAGEWSMFERRVFYIQDIASPIPPTTHDIATLEYFIGVDPGVGMANSLTIVPGQEIDINDLFDASSLTAGFHTATVRAKNANEQWGFAETRTFYIQGSVSNPTPTTEDITSLEHFFDDDPGVGLGTAISISQGQMLDITEIINSSGLSEGYHTITIRSKNSADMWSMGETRTIYIQNINPVTPGVAGINALEYFYDQDPGVGAGVQIPISPTTDSIDTLSMMLDTGDTLTIGQHSITIRAQNENGEWGHRETVTFNVDGDCPIAGLAALSACVGEPVQLTDTSSGFVGAVDYRWYADGQLISTFEGDTVHIFTNPGTHTLSLVIENGAVCTDSTGIQVNVKPKPIVVFSAETVQLGMATFYEVDEFNVDSTYHWLWDFETDGTIDDTTDGPTSYTFSTDSTYLTTLHVTDSLGCGSTYSRMITVDPSITPPNANARFSSSPVCQGTVTSFIDLSTEIPAGSVYSWDFENDGVEDASTSGDVQFTYAMFGTYDATLLIITPGEDSLTYSENVIVTQQPIADFLVGTACAGQVTNFTDLSTSNALSSYSWDFDGDGVTDSTTVGDVTFTYASAGNYAPSLAVDNGNGCLDFKAISIVVEDGPQPDFDYTYSSSGNTATVLFDNQSAGGTSYTWDFGDGSSSMDIDPSHDFIDFEGQTFTVCLTVTNDCSQTQYCEDLTLTATNTPNSIARFSASSVCEGSSTTFVDLSTEIPAGSTYSWDFDNDGLADDSAVGGTQFTYDSDGTFTAILSIVTPDEDTLTHTESVVVTMQPTADFTVANTCVGDVITFTDFSDVNAMTTYSWDFDGDGTVDSHTIGDATFVYDNAGTYAPSLLVDNGNGCFDFEVVSVVVVDPPVAAFGFTHSTSGNTASVEFENLSTDGSSFSWDFGDGEMSTEVDPIHDFQDFDGQTFTICLMASNDCDQNQHCEQITFTVTGIRDLLNTGIKLFPNPSDGMIQLDFGDNLVEDFTVEVYDLSGKLIRDQLVDGTGQIDLLSLATGTYMLHLINQETNEHFVQTLIIE